MLLVGGAAAVGVFAIGWYLTSGSPSSSSSSAQNAVYPGAQDAPGGPFAAQGTMPSIGNLLSYNQLPGVMSAPSATSVNPFSSNYGIIGDYANPLGSSRGSGVDLSNLTFQAQ